MFTDRLQFAIPFEIIIYKKIQKKLNNVILLRRCIETQSKPIDKQTVMADQTVYFFFKCYDFF